MTPIARNPSLRSRVRSSRAALVALLVALLPVLAAAQSITRGPYLQSAASDRVILCWRTSIPCDSRVQYGKTWTNLNSTVDDATLVTNHAIPLTGLAANTTWYYSVGTSSGPLAGADVDHHFLTAPPSGRSASTRIWVIGDSGTADANARAVRDAFERRSKNHPPELWLMLGDNAYNSGYDSEYQDAIFQNMYESRLITTPLFPTYGNHDAMNSDSATQTGPYYDIFHLPSAGECGGVASGTEAYYSFDWSNVHFICLDSSESNRLIGNAMIDWLESDLAANTKPWVVAFWHHPPYSKGSHNSDTETELIEMRQNAVDRLEAYGVDLVLCGHSHSYERSFLIDGHYGSSSSFNPTVHGKDLGDGSTAGDGAYAKPSDGMAAHEGAVYAVCGVSGKYTSASLDHPAMYVGLVKLGSMILDVNGAQLDARFIDDGGAVLDHFTLTKGGATPVDTTPRVVLASGSNWKFHDQGANLGTSWRDPGFDDSTWVSGNTYAGYGESYINTVVSYGSNPNNKYITTYFRTTFDLATAPKNVQELLGDVSYDDGFVAYLNGTEIARSNLPASTIDWKTLALVNHEGQPSEVIDLADHADLLVQGTNTLAVEVHQDSGSSSDLVWDAQLSVGDFVPLLPAHAAAGNLDSGSGVPLDVLRINGSTGGLARSVDMADQGSLTIDLAAPPSRPNAHFALFAWFSVPTDADVVPLGSIGELCFPPIYWISNNLGIGPPGDLPSTSAPWSYTEPTVGAPLDVVLQAVMEETSKAKLRTTNAVLVRVQ